MSAVTVGVDGSPESPAARWAAREAARCDVSPVVVGRRDRSRTVGARIGPVTHAVLRHAHAPVAVVPHD